MLGAKYTELREAVCGKYVRALRALINLSHPDQPHLGPTSLGPRDLFKLRPGGLALPKLMLWMCLLLVLLQILFYGWTWLCPVGKLFLGWSLGWTLDLCCCLISGSASFSSWVDSLDGPWTLFIALLCLGLLVEPLICLQSGRDAALSSLRSPGWTEGNGGAMCDFLISQVRLQEEKRVCAPTSFSSSQYAIRSWIQGLQWVALAVHDFLIFV